MSNPFNQMKGITNTSTIRIPFDPKCTPRAQIEASIASLLPRRCERHPHELRPVDVCATVRNALCSNCSNGRLELIVDFRVSYERCSQCPHSQTDHDIGVKDCACNRREWKFEERSERDSNGRPLPTRFGYARVLADESAQEQFKAWVAKADEFRCPFSNEMLKQLGARLIPPLESWSIPPQFAPCLQCSLEGLGITPDEARATFDGFLVDPPALQPHLDVCRAFAAAPKGVLLLLGNCGTGKTHLAIAILRELLRRGESGLIFIKHRHFLAQHWHALRPVAFREEPPESPLRRCQASSLLVYDELTTATDNSRAHEEVLLDLFEARIGHFKPSIITANLNPAELEQALGSRLFDRLRRTAFAVLEFGFESKRQGLSNDYLGRAVAL